MKTILEKLNETALEKDLVGKKLNSIGLESVYVQKIIKTNLSPSSIKRYIKSDGEKYPFYNETVDPGTDFEIDDSGYSKYTLVVCQFLENGSHSISLNDYRYVALTEVQVSKLLENATIKNTLIETVKGLLNRHYEMKAIQKSMKDLSSVLFSSNWEADYQKLYQDANDLEGHE